MLPMSHIPRNPAALGIHRPSQQKLPLLAALCGLQKQVPELVFAIGSIRTHIAEGTLVLLANWQAAMDLGIDTSVKRASTASPEFVLQHAENVATTK